MRKTLVLTGVSAALLVALGGAASATGAPQDNDVVDTDIANTSDSLNTADSLNSSVTKSLNDHNLNVGGILSD